MPPGRDRREAASSVASMQYELSCVRLARHRRRRAIPPLVDQLNRNARLALLPRAQVASRTHAGARGGATRRRTLRSFEVTRSTTTSGARPRKPIRSSTREASLTRTRVAAPFPLISVRHPLPPITRTGYRYRAGSLSSNRDPRPTSDSRRSSPPSARARPRAIGRPRPVPDPSRV